MLVAVIDHLDRILQSSEQLMHGVVEPPLDRSPIASAYASGERDAFDIANGLVHAAEDHLRVIVQICRAGILPGFALYSLLRVAGEAIVRAHYLLDTSISERSRLARALNERLMNVVAQRKLIMGREAARAPRGQTGEEARISADIAVRVGRLEARANQLGIEPLRSSGKPHVVRGYGDHPKSVSELFKESFGADKGLTMFSLLSGHVHSMRWAQAPLSRATASDDPGVALVDTGLDVQLLVSVLEPVVRIYDMTVGRWIVLAGQPFEIWTLAKQRSP